IPVSRFYAAFRRAKDNGRLPGPFGYNGSLYQNPVLADTVTIGVFSGKLDDCAGSNKKPAPLRDPEIAVYPDPSAPDSISDQRLIAVRPCKGRDDVTSALTDQDKRQSQDPGGEQA